MEQAVTTAARPAAGAHGTGAVPVRLDGLDALRGAAVLWMTAYRLAFDLDHFGLWPQDFRGDPFWTVQRACIVGLFLFCAGLSQAVALRQGLGWPRFWRRWAQVAGCALLVTAGSWLLFPRSFIYFGVLHGLAVMLVVMLTHFPQIAEARRKVVELVGYDKIARLTKSSSGRL